MCDRNMRRLYRLFVFTDARSRQLRELNENRKCGSENIAFLQVLPIVKVAVAHAFGKP